MISNEKVIFSSPIFSFLLRTTALLLMDDFERPFTIKLLYLQNISEIPPAHPRPRTSLLAELYSDWHLFCLNRIKVPTKSPQIS